MALSLLTGFPGFIGRRLAKHLLDDDAEASVVALVERRMLAAGREAAAAIDPERIEVLAGDIIDRRLGLEDADYDRLAAEVRRVFHLAAIYDLAVPVELAQRVNVGGTGNVVEFCTAAESLERLAYVSTAYVAGLRTGVVYEHELVMGQGFKNHYESTKFQAEVWVREAMDRVPTTIVRPAIVVGDSRTGETQKFDGPYYLLRSISLLDRRGLAVPCMGKADAPFNAVPVDFIVDALVAAGRDDRATGRTLHLVDPEPLSARELTALFSRAYAGRAPRGSMPPAAVEATLRFAPARRLLSGMPRESVRYVNHPVRFDTRQATDLLSRHGIVCPRLPDYVDALVRFFKAHETDPALATAPS